MNLMKMAYKIAVGSCILFTSTIIFNVYFVHDDKALDKEQCLLLFNSMNFGLCYNMQLVNKDYCPINSQDENNGKD